MIYCGVNSLCALDLNDLNLGISHQEAIDLLKEEGFTVVAVDLLAMARKQIGVPYKRCALLSEAPHLFDCSSLIKWLYGFRGIWLPRSLLLWSGLGKDVSENNLEPGDIICTSGRRNYPVESIAGGIGHVGMATSQQTIIHASNHVGVEEVTLDYFLSKRSFRVARRLASNDAVITLKIPEEKEAETSDDIAWILRHKLESKRWAK